MADQELQSPLAPTAVPPERVGTVYEAKIAPDMPGGRGPLRFEEGIATDTAVPEDFQTGIMDGYITPPGRPNHNTPVFIQPPEKTMQQRAHLGSASWVEAPTYKQAFVDGAGPEAEQSFIQVDRSGGRYERVSPARVVD
jgi:hypothetical protein